MSKTSCDLSLSTEDLPEVFKALGLSPDDISEAMEMLGLDKVDSEAGDSGLAVEGTLVLGAVAATEQAISGAPADRVFRVQWAFSKTRTMIMRARRLMPLTGQATYLAPLCCCCWYCCTSVREVAAA